MLVIRFGFVLIFLTVFKLSFIQTQNLRRCYSCNEGLNPNCGVSFLNSPDSVKTWTIQTNVACVTFKNKYDSGSKRYFCIWLKFKIEYS